MLRKTLLAAGALAFMLALGVERAHAQYIGNAVQDVVNGLSAGIGRGQLAVVSMGAPTDRVSDDIIDRMIAAFRREGFTVVARDDSRLDRARDELDFQRSREVNRSEAQRIGGFLAARYIVTGTFERFGDSYRLRGELIEVGTAEFRTQPASVRLHRSYRIEIYGFAPIDRGQTMALNLVPGVGSFVLMNDMLGGAIQLAAGGAGWGMLIGGLARGLNDRVYDPALNLYNDETNRTALVLVAGGAALIATQNVINVVRSLTYTRPASPRGGISLANPEAWNIAIIPGGNGIEQVSLSYALRLPAGRR